MSSLPPAKIIVLGLGNDICGDDGIGIAAVRILRGMLDDACIAVEESSEAGLALVEILEGYDRALILDSIRTGTCPPGTIIEMDTAQFRRVIAPSPHYAGLPEVLDLAERLELRFPSDIRVLAMEVEDPYSIREGLTPCVAEALPRFVERARSILAELRDST
ncbi:MAG: hydrogenase maturation protease [Bacteroidota bacterium]|nr:hydrogenase maturation protease [Bacteroidota bacterium]